MSAFTEFLRELHEKGTERPWWWSDGLLWNEEEDECVLAHGESVDWEMSATNRDLIAFTRNALPAIIEALEAADGERNAGPRLLAKLRDLDALVEKKP